MTEAELARMLKRRPELLTASAADLADAISWARFPTDLDSTTMRLKAPPAASALFRKTGTLTSQTLNWIVANTSTLRYMTDDTPCAEPVSIRVIVYTKQRHKRIEEVYAKIYNLVAKHAVTSPHLIQTATFENRIDKRYPRISLTITKKGETK